MTHTTQGGPPGGGEQAGAPEPPLLERDRAAPLTPLMARVDVAVAAVLALIGATLTVAMPRLIASGGIDTERDFSTMSSALIPRIAFGFVTVLALAVLIPAVRTARSGVGRPRADEFSRMQRAGIAMVIAIGYAMSVTWLGYILSTMLMTAAMAFYLGLRNPLMFIPGVIIIPVLIRFVFERLLLISLPRSSIESVGVVEDAVLRFFSNLLIS